MTQEYINPDKAVELALAAMTDDRREDTCVTIRAKELAAAMSAAIQSHLESRSGEAIAWCDGAAFNGGVGNVCSTAAKRYWEKSDWVDRKNAELHTHPLFTHPGPVNQQPVDHLKGIDAGPLSEWVDLVKRGYVPATELLIREKDAARAAAQVNQQIVKDLFGAYWEIAYREGKFGESFAVEANTVLSALDVALAAVKEQTT